MSQVKVRQVNKSFLVSTTLFRAVVIAWAAYFSFPSLGFAQESSKAITIGTGSAAGVYSPIGKSLCMAMNDKQDKHGISCSAINSKGSVFNINQIRAGKFDFGVAQSDVQYFAVKGYGPFKDQGPYAKLRSVLSFHSEAFTVVARADAEIKTIDDLVGKRVNIGNPGSGQRTTFDLVMFTQGWTKDNFALTMELPTDQQAEALCANKIDAMIFTVGNPNASIKDASYNCKITLVNVVGPKIKQLVEKYPYFSVATIPGATYEGADEDVETFGVRATLVTSSDTPDDVVFALLDSLFSDFEILQYSHAALLSLNPRGMASRGLSAPLHSGAKRFFQNR